MISDTVAELSLPPECDRPQDKMPHRYGRPPPAPLSADDVGFDRMATDLTNRRPITIGQTSSVDLQRWEPGWLGWARPIVRMQACEPAHFAWCREALGPAEYPEVAEDPASDPTLRWPGYLGIDWKPDHGVLFVGSVHSDFRKDGHRGGGPDRAALVARMAVANRRWRDLEVDSAAEDARYLDATRGAYSRLMPGWSRDSAFGAVRRELGDAVEEIAWTNLAHCRAQPKLTPGSGGEYTLQRKCSGVDGTFPIKELLDAIRPAAVLACASPLGGRDARRFDLIFSHGGAPLVWTFNGRTAKCDGVEPEVWAKRFTQIGS